MSNITPAQLIQQRQNQFIENRTIIENEVNRCLTSLRELDEDLRQRCGVTDNASARTILPALWAEPFVMENYQSQLAAFQGYLSQVLAIQAEINKEAEECLRS